MVNKDYSAYSDTDFKEIPQPDLSEMEDLDDLDLSVLSDEEFEDAEEDLNSENDLDLSVLPDEESEEEDVSTTDLQNISESGIAELNKCISSEYEGDLDTELQEISVNIDDTDNILAIPLESTEDIPAEVLADIPDLSQEKPVGLNVTLNIDEKHVPIVAEPPKDEHSDVIFEQGMSLLQFLKQNKNIRTDTEVLKYFSENTLQKAYQQGAIYNSKGKIII